MKRVLMGLLAFAFLAAAFPVESQAQIDDHLKCYKIKDTAKFKVEVDLLSQQFGDERCAVKGKGALFCVMATKVVDSATFEDKSKPPLVPDANFGGQTLVEDRICYKIKCPTPTIDPLLAADQFGTRTIGKFKPAFMCTPAIKVDPPPPCDDSAAPTCVADCPAPLVCKTDPVAGCSCQDDDPVPCTASAPMCNGDCPDPTQICVQLAGTTICECQDPTPVVCDQGLDPTMCTTGTTCPPGERCDIDPTGAICQCQP